ncbi:glucosamine-6-phosphate isomerase 1 [Podospora fimiseda]|uniref:Glucosamine-6-phosphate isomerase n=1 Tax=Podospora fimiseda TaxID=252190 RepID=A0AAN7C014_9PEZI|nr:glucosamine-6-phosphate isomerase 1 [Podospora fimiseda]
MRFIIKNNEDEASSYAANYIINRITQFSPSEQRPFVLGLPTGSSPLGVYRILVQRYKAGEVSFENVVTFNMDEYINIPRDHQGSYHSFMWTNLFSHINIPPGNVNILDGNAPNLEAECIAYEAKIKAVGGIDLFLAGIGEDGHIAFNEPGSSLASRTRVKTLAYDTILANSRFFDDNLELVPKMALTVGVQTVLEAREVVVMVLGARKALALQQCIEQGVNHMWTLSALQLHPHPMIICDEDATLELKVKTVKYFKDIERVARAEGFDQILPSNIRTDSNLKLVPAAVVVNGVHTPPCTSPQSTASHHLLLPPSTPTTCTSRSRSPSPDFTNDRMGSRIGDPAFTRRLTPAPEQQSRQTSE